MLDGQRHEKQFSFGWGKEYLGVWRRKKSFVAEFSVKRKTKGYFRKGAHGYRRIIRVYITQIHKLFKAKNKTNNNSRKQPPTNPNKQTSMKAAFQP